MKVRRSWVSLPLLTSLAACNAILGYGDFVKIDGDPGGSDGGKVTTDPTTSPTTDPTTVPTTNPPGTSCKDATPWGAPVAVQNVNGAGSEFLPSLSGDELTIAWSAVGSNSSIMMATRASFAGTFGTAVAATGLTSTRNVAPSFSADGLTLFWHTLDGPSQLFLVYTATRPSTTATGFTNTRQLANQVSNTLDTMNPVVTRDGSELFLLRANPNITGSKREIWHALKNGNDFAAPTQLAELSASVTDDVDSIAITPDKLTLYFSSRRSGGPGLYDIFMVTRPTPAGPFGAPALGPLTAVNSGTNDDVSFLSSDNCRLYFSSDRTGSNNDDIFVSSRSP